MSNAPRYVPHYTVDDYRCWEGDWELWQGIPVAMTPSPFGRHQELAVKLASALLGAVEAAECDATVLSEIDWIICNDTVVRPDVLVLCGKAPERHVETPPALVAEILSPSTSTRDRVEKRELYADHGVDHYIIIDPSNNSHELFSRVEGRLVRVEVSSVLTLTICQTCNLSIQMDRVLR